MKTDSSEWDRRFFRLAEEIASWSKDPARKVGAVVVSPDRMHWSSGYNGLPSQVDDDPALLRNKEEKLAVIVHAEVNALRHAYLATDGATLYVTSFPCQSCARAVITAGIKRVVTIQPSSIGVGSHWELSERQAERALAQAGVEVSFVGGRGRPGLKLVLGMSADGVLAKGRNDSMAWLSDDDKKVFRLLTGVGGVCGAGIRTALVMPRNLRGRMVLGLSRHGLTVQDFAARHPGAWLLGGPTVARVAWDSDLIDEVHLCRSTGVFACSVTSVPSEYLDWVTEECLDRWGLPTLRTSAGTVNVETWRRPPHGSGA